MNEDLKQRLLDEYVKETYFQRMGNKTVVCLLTTNSGFEFIGKAHCLDVSKFNQEIGEKFALEDALKSLSEAVFFHESQMKK